MIEYPAEIKSRGRSSTATRYRNEVLKDYYSCIVSREVSLLGRKEVLTGKAKFGILGDGKELPQVAMARVFKKGDWRSGYYRDQTFMMAKGLCSVKDYFAQLYADSDNDPFSGGRQMNAHFCSRTIDAEGRWLDHREMYNVSSDISCTAGQVGRALGIALASSRFRSFGEMPDNTFSVSGNEVSFCTIGDASTSEGAFWETMNAAAVMKVPLLMAVWDDGYGISVPIELQTTKGSISRALEGFLIDEEGNGIRMYTVKAWDYPHLIETFERATDKVREEHIPALVHVQECTQPQGHSTSGSHERYKSKDRLQWETDFDGIVKMEEWMIENDLIDLAGIDSIKEKAIAYARKEKQNAWSAFNEPIVALKNEALSLATDEGNEEVVKELKSMINPTYGEVVQQLRRLLYTRDAIDNKQTIEYLISNIYGKADKWFHSHLTSESDRSPINLDIVGPKYSDDSESLTGYQILNKYFDKKLSDNPYILAFGEDVGHIGDVNQGFVGLQEKYSRLRVFDTGIREWTIMGQAIGLAMRGFRPIAEIQYLDYLIYGHSPLSDDLATLRYRSFGQQMAPAIIRTRGHRLEGIWHAGSPLGMLINSLRGMHVLVPRNMTKAAGFYNTLLEGDDPALVIECLNGYRLKEVCPDNLGDYMEPLGVPEILIEGNDVSLVTYGSCVRLAETAIKTLDKMNVSVELIDVQTLLPFDMEHRIVSSIKKTNRIIFLDEDVPGGATAYMMREVLEVQGGYRYLDAPPLTLTARAHRPPYGSDGDYFSKPNVEDIVDIVLSSVNE